MRLRSIASTSGLPSGQPVHTWSCMNRRRSEICWLAPFSRTSTPDPSTALPSARVHLEVGVALELADLHEGAPAGRRQPLLRSAILASLPRGADEGQQLLARSARPQRLAQVRAARRVEAEVPEAVRGEAAAVAGPAEGRGGGGDDPEHAAVEEPEALGGRGGLLHDRLDPAIALGEADPHLSAGHPPGHAPPGRRTPLPVLRGAQ